MKQGDRVRILNNIPSVNGTLYKGDRCKIDEMGKKIRITDAMGRIWYVNRSDIQVTSGLWYLSLFLWKGIIIPNIYDIYL